MQYTKAVCAIAISMLVSLAITVHAQAHGWQWARSASGTGTVAALCAGTQGDAYITGQFLGSLTLGGDTVNDSLGPYQDIFVAKYDSAGNVLWARNASGYADADGISTDVRGNVFITGNFYNDSLSFGSHVLTNTTHGSSNIFLVKYDPLGNVIWAENLGGTGTDFANGVCTDRNGNLYVTGYFTSDSLILGSIVLHQAGVDNVFLAKFDSTGQILWAQSEGEATSDGPNAVCTDAYGNAFITGYFTSASMIFGNDSLSSPYLNNIFITKYDSSGNVIWAKYAGGASGNIASGISADASGNVYVTGYFSGQIIFNSDTLVCAGFQNIFTAKYSASGTLLWAKSAGGTNVDQSNGICTDGAGNAYLTGYFQSDTVTFGSAMLINSTGNEITFVAKYDSTGAPEWFLTPQGTSNNAGTGISYSTGNIYVAGAFQSSDIVFGGDTLSQQGLFLAKLDTSHPTGINIVNDLRDPIIVYPNPSAGIFYFKGVANGNTIEVYDLQGRNVYTATVSGDHDAVFLSGRSEGMYFYRVSDQGSTIWLGKITLE